MHSNMIALVISELKVWSQAIVVFFDFIEQELRLVNMQFSKENWILLSNLQAERLTEVHKYIIVRGIWNVFSYFNFTVE